MGLSFHARRVDYGETLPDNNAARGEISMNIVKSVDRYDAWLRKQLKDDFAEEDLKKKHKKMAKDAFQFLRATYWRWAETIDEVCPELMSAPDVLAVGDLHAENFGTWRDGEGRLIWGVNDFDEAARMPYAIDIVRLAASAVLADVRGISDERICESILAGYREGITDPKPFVLDRENKELRDIFIVSDDQRAEFWAKFDPAQLKAAPDKDMKPVKKPPSRYAKVLKHARPDNGVEFQYFARSAGTGSLGRPRFVGIGAWRGDLIVRETKAIARSGWVLTHRGSHKLRCAEIASGRYRSPDPTYQLHGNVLVRRLSPNDFKIETKQKEKKKGEKAAAELENPKAVERKELVNAAVLHAMGRDLAAIHRGTDDSKNAIQADLKRRKAGWIFAAVGKTTRAVKDDHKAWKEHHDSLPSDAAG
jgi:hypothetical protein